MVALMQGRRLDFAGVLPSAARAVISDTLADDPSAGRRVYAALAHKVWTLLIERRFDAEIRDWHALLNQFKAHVRKVDAVSAERATALADLLRESISLSEASPAREVAKRPNARRILQTLHEEGGFVARRRLLDTLEMRSSNLSNVLTQLVAHNLVDRRDKGKEAEFRLTRFGSQVLLGEDITLALPVSQSLADDLAKLERLVISVSLEWESQCSAPGSWCLPTSADPLFGPVSISNLFLPNDHADTVEWLSGRQARTLPTHPQTLEFMPARARAALTAST